MVTFKDNIKIIKLIFLFTVAWIMAGCNSLETKTPTLIIGEITLTPYLSPTIFPVTQVASESAGSPTPVPLPTAMLYQVKEGDTLSSISESLDVSIDALLAANPEIDLKAIWSGTQLLVPDKNGDLNILTSTLVGVEMKTPNCYPSGDQGIWCLVVVQNTTNTPVEGLSVTISLLSPTGEVSSKEASSPLERLIPGKAMPLMAYFAPPLPEEWQPSAVFKSLLPGQLEDDRYVPVSIDNQEMVLSPDGTRIRLTGDIRISEGNAKVSLVWILAVAYGQDGQIVGIRKWESTEDLKPGNKIAFDMELFSLGPKIANVDIQGEARP